MKNPPGLAAGFPVLLLETVLGARSGLLLLARFGA
jgi:hypothetical protein